jgi:(E)-4-hydroxy-3-methyl-but-2-enyl pyrophosphate reductase
MHVIVAESAGFCRGVRRAVEKARLVAAGATPVYTDGPLIHNRQMMDRLRGEGVVECDDPACLAGGKLLIRAHGIPPARRHMLSQLPIELVDATCPDVARIQGLIRQHARRGCHVVVFGDPDHPEVVGLLGFAEERGHVVRDATEVDRLPAVTPVCLVAQSTQSPVAYREVEQAMRRRFRELTVLDTICASTKRRQDELAELAPRVDAFVVVGGTHSANTIRLVRLAQGMRPTFHIETAAELNADALKTFRTVGLTAGASTPAFVIEDVRHALADLPDPV